MIQSHCGLDVRCFSILAAGLACSASPESRPLQITAGSAPTAVVDASADVANEPLALVRSASVGVNRTLNFHRPFFDVTAMVVVGERLLVADRMMSPHFAVITRLTGRAERWFGLHGNRVGQFTEPGCISIATVNPPTVWLYDKAAARLSLAQLDAPRDRVLLEHASLDVPRGTQCAHWGSGRILATGLYTDAMFAELNRNGRQLGTMGVPPFPGARLLNQYATAQEPEGNRVAIGFRYAARIDLARTSGLSAVTTRPPTAINLRVTRRVNTRTGVEGPPVPDDSLTEHAYVDVTASRQYVYALFCGCGPMRTWMLAKTVHVFDWEGAFVGELLLDHGVSKLAVSEDDYALYAAYHDSPTTPPTIGEWLLPAWLRESAPQRSPNRQPSASS